MTGCAPVESGTPNSSTNLKPSGAIARRLTTLLAVLVACGALFSVGASSASALAPNFFGLHFSDYTQYTDPQAMDAIQKSGAKRFRANVNWSLKNPSNWEPFDSLFGLAWERDIKLIPVLYGRQNGSAQFPTSGEYAAWEGWVKSVIQRYGQGGSFWAGKANPLPPEVWEVWNEPNLTENNPGGQKIQPQNYANFLQVTAGAIRSVQPSADILFGGLFSAATSKNGSGEYTSMNVKDFLAATHEVAGTAQAFTAFSLHPYAFRKSPSEATLKIVDRVEENVNFARTALNLVPGGSTKAIWITELGWGLVGGENQPPANDENDQATLLTQSFNRIKNNLAETKGIQALIWYFYRDSGTPAWNTTDGLRRADGTLRPSWSAFQAQTGAPPWSPPKPKYAEELGFVAFKTAPKNTHIDTYFPGPTYKSLLSSSDTGYPAVSEPQKAQALAIDTDGDGIDELGFLALSNPGNVHLDTYKGAPDYKALASNCNTGYPSIADPSKAQALAIDTNGDGIDELGILSLTNPGNVHMATYANPPCYNVLLSSGNTGYPSIADPSKAQALAIDTDGDGIDELGFLALSNPGSVHLDTYKGAPGYQTLASNCNTGYPSIAEPKYAQALAMDWNGDGADELGFLAYQTASGATHLDAYAGGPCYTTLASNSDTSYPAVSNPENLQALSLNTSTAAYDPPPVWSAENIGGAISGDPDIASWGSGRLDVVARGTDNGLWQRGYQSPTWYPWNKIGSSLTSGPGAVSWGPGRIDIAARTTNNSVQHWWYDQSAGVWNSDNLGGVVTSDPDISSWGSGRLDVFANGTDNAIKHKPWYSNAWFPWDALPVEAVTSGPAAVSWGPGRIDVVARIANNTVKHWSYQEGAGGWNTENLGGNVTSAPDISSWGPNRLDIFAKGPENSLVHKFWWGGGWSGWESLGGTLASGPGAVSWGPNRIDVVARLADNTVQRWFYVDP